LLYSETELKKRLKSGCPVFYFYASDEALVRSAAAKAEKFLSEEAPDTTTLDGPTPSVEDIVLALEEFDLSNKQCKALLKSPSPLADVYADFEKSEFGYMDHVRDIIESRANTLVRSDSLTLLHETR